ncbi:hypothetical protein [Actinomadura oligospora]|uniref:hypothetical protein n=1 Tax=Actinomadura oligospora TaxID=111804 RepID=UPI0004AE9029|nr:hypothetical protein [Actinomadura oligospora]
MDGVDITWMGQQVRATSYPTEAYLARLTSANLTLLQVKVTHFTPDFPGMGPEPQLFCYARRPEPASDGA